MTLYAQICKALKVQRKDNEELLAFSLRVAKKANGLDNDDDWAALGDKIQTWAVSVLKAKELAGNNADPEIPALDGWPGEAEAETSDEDSDDEATDEDSDSDEDEDADSDEATEDGDEDGEATSSEVAEESVDESEDSAQEEASDEGAEEEAEAPKARKTKEQKPKTTAKPQKSKEKPKPKTTVKGKEKDMPTTKAAKSTKTPASQSARTRIDPKGTIKVLAKKNPHRDGTKNFTSFSKYKEGMTVEAAIKAKIPAKNIYYEAKLGNIKVIAAKKAAA